MSLLTTTILEIAYYQAKRNDIEWLADTFWQAYIILQFPQVQNYMVACQSAPSSNSRSRVDITVKQLRGDERKFLSTLLLCEVKREGSSDLKKGEKQVLAYAKEYLSESGEGFVYCMTSWGIKARCWVYYSGGEDLRPMFGKTEIGSKSAYVDAHDEARAGLISASIAFMKGESTTWPGELESHQSTQSGEGSAAGSSANTQTGYAQASSLVATSSTGVYGEWVKDEGYDAYRRFNNSTQEWEWYQGQD